MDIQVYTWTNQSQTTNQMILLVIEQEVAKK